MRRLPAPRMRCRLARYRLHRNGDLAKEGRRKISPVIRSLENLEMCSSSDQGWAGNSSGPSRAG